MTNMRTYIDQTRSMQQEIHELAIEKGWLDIVLKRAREIMCEEIRQEWKWIVVPMDVEASFAPVDRSWHEKDMA